MPGFGVRVLPSGRKGYVVQYKVGGRHGETRRKALGLHGVLTAEEARAQARKWLGERATGKDPIGEHVANRAAETIERLCQHYVEATEKSLVLGKGGRPKKPSTLATDLGRIKRHVVPLLGKKKVRELTSADVARFIRDVTTGKTAADERTGRYGRAIVKGGAGTAARTAGLLSGIMAFAVQEGIRSDNPCHGVRKPASGTRQKRLEPADYRALGEALDDFMAEGGSPLAAAMVRVLALTGMRLGEVLSLRQSEIDRLGQALWLGDTKSGASVHPLGAAALAVLNGIETPSDCPFAFPSPRGEGAYRGLRNAFRRIIALKPELKEVTPHTLRHSYASTAADLGFTELTVGALIGHRTGSVTSRYVHHLDKVLIAAADRVAEQIEAWMCGISDGDVIELQRESALPTARSAQNVGQSAKIVPLRSQPS